jgi:hypothetical protein
LVPEQEKGLSGLETTSSSDRTGREKLLSLTLPVRKIVPFQMSVLEIKWIVNGVQIVFCV